MEQSNKKIDWVKYLAVFVITALLFVSAAYLSNYFSKRKINEVKSIQDTIFIDLLSSETQFSLLQESSCKDVTGSVLSQELASLAERISYSERNINIDQQELLHLKRYYSLLEIKDYLLMKQLDERCALKSEFILYFYKNADCPDCVSQSYILGTLRDKYPQLRVYSFDYNLDLSAVRTLISIYDVPPNMPSLVMDGKVYEGLQDVEEIEEALPGLEELKKKQEAEAKKKAQEAEADASND